MTPHDTTRTSRFPVKRSKSITSAMRSSSASKQKTLSSRTKKVTTANDLAQMTNYSFVPQHDENAIYVPQSNEADLNLYDKYDDFIVGELSKSSCMRKLGKHHKVPTQALKHYN